MTDALKMLAIAADAMDWTGMVNEVTGRTFHIKHLLKDPDTGMEIMLVRYPAGVVTPPHQHPCAHGLYVLEGVLKTPDGLFGPGNLVWFPEGGIGEHGATLDASATLLFITNKPFAITYV